MKLRIEHTFNEILLAGNQDIYLNGLLQMLDRMGAAMRISCAGNPTKLKTYLQKNKEPELVILISPFIRYSDSSILNKIYKWKSNGLVMLMAENHELPLVLSFVQEGGKIAISKSCTEIHLKQALNSAYKNTFYFCPYFADEVIHKGLNTLSMKGKARLVEISNREKEIIRLMWNDYTNKEIAEMLNLSPRTLESHRNHIYQKLNVKTLGGIFKYGLENGIIS
jgi:DNA-binding NarL/FixJ family response regulator